MWLVEIAVNISAIGFFIALSLNRHAEKYFWISYALVAVDLIVIGLILYKPVMSFYSVRKLPPLPRN